MIDAPECDWRQADYGCGFGCPRPAFVGDDPGAVYAYLVDCRRELGGCGMAHWCIPALETGGTATRDQALAEITSLRRRYRLRGPSPEEAPCPHLRPFATLPGGPLR